MEHVQFQHHGNLELHDGKKNQQQTFFKGKKNYKKMIFQEQSGRTTFIVSFYWNMATNAERCYSFFAFLSIHHTPCTKTALSLPRHLTLFTFSRPGTHKPVPPERAEQERMAYLCKYAVLLCHVTHTHTFTRCNAAGLPGTGGHCWSFFFFILEKLGLAVSQQSLLFPPLPPKPI